jgi:hypothetical protein
VPVEDPHLQDSRAYLPADLVADAVADDRRDDDDEDHQRQVHVAAAGRDAAEHGGGLPRDDEPDEQGVLGEHQQADQNVDEHAGYAQDVVDQAAHAALPRRSG